MGKPTIIINKHKYNIGSISKYTKKGEEVDDIYINRILPDKMKYNLDYIKNRYDMYRLVKHLPFWVGKYGVLW